MSAEGYNNGKVDLLTITTTSEIWVNMKDVGSGMGVKNISDLVLKEIYGICETKNPTKERVNVKWQKEKFIKSLLTQAKKNQTQKTIKRLMSEMMSWLLLLNVAGVKKRRGLRAIDGLRKKLMIQDSEIPKSSEFEVKSKIGKMFQYQNPSSRIFC